MELLERYRILLAASQADGFLALLGLGSGVIAALVIVAFRSAIDLIKQLYMPVRIGIVRTLGRRNCHQGYLV